MMNVKTLLAGLFLFSATSLSLSFTLPGTLHAQDRFVAPGGNNAGQCTDSASPCATIGFALNGAGSGDVIHVQAGVYTETLFIDENVTLRGAGAGETIIQAAADRGLAASRVVFVAGAATDARIEELTIRHGNDPLAGSVGGGGLFVQGVLELVNARVENNNAAGTGGGLSGETDSRITLVNTVVAGNAAVGNGGGIFSAGEVIIRDGSILVDNSSGNSGGGLHLDGSGLIENSYIISNGAQTGGGINHSFWAGPLVITRSVLDDNASTSSGAGMFSLANLTISESRITNNTDVGSGGGGLYITNQASVTNTIIAGNSTPSSGGGIRVSSGTLHLTGSLVSGNKAGNGAGLFLDAALATLTNVTVTGNDAVFSGGGLYNTNDSSPGITNTIIWGNRAGTAGNQVQNLTMGLNMPQISHSLIEGALSGGSWQGSLGSNLGGNLDTNPEFLAPEPASAAPTADGIYRTVRNSAVVNAGQTPADLALFPGGPAGPVDLAGNPRVDGPAIDMGAYEFQGDPLPPGAFVTTWRTDNPGSSGNNQITIPITGTGYNFTVNWGDGTSTTWQTGNPIANLTHTYPEPGTYTVSITGSFPRIYFNNQGDKEKILTIEQWGDIAWTSMENAFFGAENLTIRADDAPDLTGVTSMNHMFALARVLNADLNHWDVSNVEDMNSLFLGATVFNGNISNWDVSNVRDMSAMFYGNEWFNQPIGGWDVSRVEEMRNMFMLAYHFNQPVGNWDVSNVHDMSQMFLQAWRFNQPIGDWDVSNVTRMTSMFFGALSFNQPIGNWDVSNLTGMVQMFWNARSFNQNISTRVVNEGTPEAYTAWDVSGVTNMRLMFNRAVSFNQPIGNWQVGNVEDMTHMFRDAESFNQPLGDWDVSNVTVMLAMFEDAAAFDQPLGTWNVGNVLNMEDMFNNAGLSTASYDATLAGWAGQAVQPGLTLGAEGLTYCAAASARQVLTGAPNNWTITDAGPADGCGFPELDNPRVLASNRSGFVFGDTGFDPTHSVEITSLPHRGQMLLDGAPLAAGTRIPVPDIDTGRLTWSHTTDEYGYNYTSFSALIVDDTGATSDPFTVHIDLGEANLVIAHDGEGWRKLGSPALGETFESLLSPLYTIGIPGSNDPGSANPNVFRPSRAGFNWIAPASMAEEIGLGEAFAIYVYSDDTNNGTPDGFPKTVHAGETWHGLNGSFAFPGLFHDAVAGMLNPVNASLLANPHPIALSYCAMIGDPSSNGVSHTIDVWDPSANAGYGGYVVTGCIPPLGIDHAIAPYEAFWVRTLQPDPSLHIPEEAYLETMAAPLFSMDGRGHQGQGTLADDHTHAFAIGVQRADGLFSSSVHVILSDEGTFEDDAWDTPKRSAAGFAEKWLALFATNENGIGYAIRSLPLGFGNETTIPLDVLTTEAGTFVMEGTFPAGDSRFRYFIRDNNTAEVAELANGEPWMFTMADRPYSGPAFPGTMTDIHRSDPVDGARFDLIITRGDPVALDAPAGLPERVALAQNYPNPFNPSTVIRYELPGPMAVRLEVFDITGRLVSTLVDAPMPAGRHKIRFDASNLTSGVYIYRLKAGNVVQSRKLTLIK